ncbi:lipopolysaccharide biosynthesis protein [Butyrivibrio sp. INlla16]|uniref:lipopolysaccharide biosynthesis protein n=1 Tax=Butyrivibrio sp. INlla16 TaxID=1520807 RepID=UPI00088C2054|nr:hypothetical protein [Butyrivibrio sp. INlla16]SDB67315.1 Membrane protein involved in the export of O-antigen and teichoic acid [Butyrivibrio sp. INlla16]
MIDYSPLKQKHNRKEYVARGIISALGVTIVGSVFPFIIRTVFMYTLGKEYLGLNSFYASVIQVLNLTELGIGSVMVYFLYDPISHGDYAKIGALLFQLKKIYIRIGIAVSMLGVSIMPFFTYLIKCDIPYGINIYFYYLLYLIPIVAQFLIFPEIIILLQAYQRNDLTNLITIITCMIMYIYQLVVIVVNKSYLLYMLGFFLYAVAIAVMRILYRNKLFVDIRIQGNLDRDEKIQIKKRIVSMIGHQIDEKMFNTIDNFFISAHLGLGPLAIYGNYFLVLTLVIMLLEAVYSSLLPSMGNAIASESVSSNFTRFRCILCLSFLLATWASSCLMCLYNDFMFLWTGTASYDGVVILLFCTYFYLSQVRRTVQIFKNAKGLWWNDRLKPYVSILLDFLLDLILVPCIGIKGALISSIICIALVEIPWETKALFDSYFEGYLKQYIIVAIKYMLRSLSVIVLAVGLFSLWRWNLSWGVLILKALVCSVMTVVMLVFTFGKTEEYCIWKKTIIEMVRRIAGNITVKRNG